MKQWIEVATRFAENPLLTVRSDPSVGDNVNGPSVIKVPVSARWLMKA